MLSRNNILIVAFLAAQLCFLFIISPKKSFWRDEVLTYEVVSKSNLTEMWQATKDTLNSSPPLYFVLLWLWKQLFGMDPLALRLFSTLCMMATAFLWWLILTKAYSKETATLGVIFCFGLSTLLQTQLHEARQYALLLLWMTIACYALYCSSVAGKVSWFHLVVLALSNMGMIYTHYYGILYSAGLGATGLLLHWKNKRAMLYILIAFIFAWATFIPWLPILKLHHAIASQCPWSLKVTPWALYDVLTSNIWAMDMFLPMVLLSLASSRFHGYVRTNQKIDEAKGHPVLAKPSLMPIACMMIVVVLFIFSCAFLINLMFYHRYMICSYPLWAILIAHISYQFLLNKGRPTSEIPLHTKILLTMTSVAIMGYFILTAIKEPADTQHQRILEVVNQHNIPVIDEVSLDQLPLWYYSGAPERFVFLLNSADYGCNIGPPRFLADIVKNAEGMRAMTIEKFLETNNEFYLIDSLAIDWANGLILNNPDYQCEQLPITSDILAIYHVKKVK